MDESVGSAGKVLALEFQHELFEVGRPQINRDELAGLPNLAPLRVSES